MYDEKDDVMLPEGYEEGKDFFGLGDGEAPETGQQQEQAEPAEQAPTTTGDAPAEEAPDSAAAALPTTEQLPTTGQEAGQDGHKLRFTVKVDHSDTDVELDPEELPSIYQRAQITERAQQRLQQLQPQVDRAEQIARTLGYKGLDDMLQNAESRYRDATVQRLTSEGVNQEVAEAVAAVQMGRGQAQQAGDAGEAPPATTGRDFTGEIAALREAYPETAAMSRMPDEVMRACAIEGKPLVQAYAVWKSRQQAAENERLKKQLGVLQQNQQNAARAPVTGTAGGGDTNQRPVDDFLKGFEDY